jgi:flagellar motility protein MotE (MotC chaperone)
MCSNNQEEDAVKILRFMSERSAGKILTEMSDKEMAARLCSKLKVIQEES